MGDRRDYAIFADDRFVTNALLTDEEMQRMERDGYRCVHPEDAPDSGIPLFRGRRYVRRTSPFRRGWGRD